MQTCTVLVALHGDTNNIVPKSGMSVAEVLVLMAAHGAHSVTPVANSVGEFRGEPHTVELARLASVYGVEPVEACFGKVTFSTKIPTRFSEAGINIPGDEEEDEDDKGKVKETPTARKKRIAAEKAHAALLEEAKKPLGDTGAFGAAPADKEGDEPPADDADDADSSED